MPSKKIHAATPAPTQAETLAPPPAAASDTGPPLESAITDLGRARALPETPAGQVLALGKVEYAAGSIEQFADDDGRTMRIVNAGGALHKYPVPDQVPDQVAEEA